MTTATLTEPLALQAIGVAMPELEADHPNRLRFTGVLTRLDEPSDRPPNGAHGHRVLIPHAVAEKALPTLIGMAVDVVPDLTDHDAARKIGVITEATIDGKDLCIGGHLFAKDFPEVVKNIKQRVQRGTLGASFEITDVAVEDPGADIWTLRHLLFTGAAILEKSAAAYGKTEIVATTEDKENPLMAELSDLVSTLRTVSKDLAAASAGGKQKARDEGEEDAGRIRAKADAEDEDAEAEEDDEDAKEEDEDAGGRKRGEGAEEDEEAAGDDEEAAQVLARCLQSMGVKKFLAAVGTVDAEHEDEEEDMAMLRRMLKVGRPKKAGAVAASSAMRRVERRLDDVTAAMELITDTISKQSKLLTDLVKDKRGLATDDMGRRAEDGKEVPARKTMAAQTHLPQWATKYPDVQDQKLWKEAELSTVLKNHGVDEETRMAIKLDLLAEGRLQ